MVSIKYLLEKRAGVASSSSSSSSKTGTYPGTSISSGRSSYGGGKPVSIPAGYPFAGRQVGGGTRSSIYSGRGYGSGYGAFAGGAALGGLGYYSVAGRPFPYGAWPLYYGGGYYDDGEYGPYSNSSRPGGALAAASFSPESYVSPAAIHDLRRLGVRVKRGLRLDICSALIVTPPTPVSDNGTYPSSVNETLLPPLDPTNVESYYRASSFALYSFFRGQPSNPNPTVGYTSPTSATAYLYPTGQRNTAFESCVNDTISIALPIVDSTSDSAAHRGTTPNLVTAVGVVVGVSLRQGRLEKDGVDEPDP
ncbi:SPOSA6832_01693 [Sporobolomyces salmonicolor]|uniref:SPOSA6832_01693-mRNA-1:cds n=1 Tax=Sporidiobolus salmonicolor TaxID=5005 RepID=A0A0D6EJC1_SPOSA|nr:SPOSA6832_01693 [Sporobolomyces salmonicolor]